MKKRCVLLVSRRGHLSPEIKSYGLTVAKRLNLRLLVAYIDTMPLLSDGGERHRSFCEAARQDGLALQYDAAGHGVGVNIVHDAGKVSKVVSRLCRILNDLEFIIADSGVKAQKVALSANIPVFTVSDNLLKRQLREPVAPPVDHMPELCCKLREPGKTSR